MTKVFKGKIQQHPVLYRPISRSPCCGSFRKHVIGPRTDQTQHDSGSLPAERNVRTLISKETDGLSSGRVSGTAHETRQHLPKLPCPAAPTWAMKGQVPSYTKLATLTLPSIQFSGTFCIHHAVHPSMLFPTVFITPNGNVCPLSNDTLFPPSPSQPWVTSNLLCVSINVPALGIS